MALGCSKQCYRRKLGKAVVFIITGIIIIIIIIIQYILAYFLIFHYIHVFMKYSDSLKH